MDASKWCRTQKKKGVWKEGYQEEVRCRLSLSMCRSQIGGMDD